MSAAQQWSPADHPRVPAGQFTEKPKDEPVIDLWAVGQGTWEAPPWPTSAMDLVQFWSTVEIPEGTVERARLLYEARSRDDCEMLMNRWKDAHPYPMKSRSAQIQWNRDMEQHRIDEIDNGYFKLHPAPETIPVPFYSSLVRMAKMSQYALYLPKPEVDRLCAMPVRMPGGTVNPFLEIVKGFQLSHLADLLDDTPRVQAMRNALKTKDFSASPATL